MQNSEGIVWKVRIMNAQAGKHREVVWSDNRGELLILLFVIRF
jgi:hypothetical protein